MVVVSSPLLLFLIFLFLFLLFFLFFFFLAVERGVFLELPVLHPGLLGQAVDVEREVPREGPRAGETGEGLVACLSFEFFFLEEEMKNELSLSPVVA